MSAPTDTPSRGKGRDRPKGGQKGGEGTAGRGSQRRALPEKSGPAAGLKGSKKIRSVGRCPNKCAIEAWRGWERFSVFDGDKETLLASTAASAALVGVCAKRDLSHACVWLSLAAHMNQDRYAPILASMAKVQWAEVAGERLESVLHEWCRKANARWVLHEAPAGGESTTLTQVSSAAPAGAQTRDVWHFLRVASDVGYHLLPIGGPSDVVVPWVDLFPAPPPEPTPQEAPPAEPVLVAEPVTTPLAPPTPTSSPAPRTFPTVQKQRGVYVSGTRRYEGIFPPPPDRVVIPDSCGREEFRRSNPVYPPVQSFSWMAGWLASEGIVGRPSYWRRRPDVASATTDNFARYADTVVYYLPKAHRFTPVGRRGLTDGVSQFTFFAAGDTLTRGGVEWAAVKFQWEDLELLKVVRRADAGVLSAATEPAGYWLNHFFSRGPPPVVVKAPCAEQLPSAVTDRMAYDIARQDADDALQPLINRGWVEWQAQQGGATAPKAEVVYNYARQLREHTAHQPFAYSGGRPFLWGYCYSCGKQLPSGRMPGRLCGCAQTPAARMLANGQHIAHLGGVVYPGVVTTESKHPPLKSGKQTLANSQCFREPPLGQRH